MNANLVFCGKFKIIIFADAVFKRFSKTRFNRFKFFLLPIYRCFDYIYSYTQTR